MFGIYSKKVKYLFIFSVKGKKFTFLPSHFTRILFSSAHLVDILLCVNIVCT